MSQFWKEITDDTTVDSDFAYRKWEAFKILSIKKAWHDAQWDAHTTLKYAKGYTSTLEMLIEAIFSYSDENGDKTWRHVVFYEDGDMNGKLLDKRVKAEPWVMLKPMRLASLDDARKIL